MRLATTQRDATVAGDRIEERTVQETQSLIELARRGDEAAAGRLLAAYGE